ncbi:MAG: Conjugal transfer protein TraG, partial [Phenylobacterium sp.]|nr:Conjugal transfer protein TraG [Phenylobacterium sp.]
PAVRGRKIVYWRERAFASRVAPPPQLASRALTPAPLPSPASPGAPRRSRAARATSADDDLRLDRRVSGLRAAGVQPLPLKGASDADVAPWTDEYHRALSPRDRAPRRRDR